MTESTVEHRVFGPPGTGKTTFLATQIARWAQEVGSDRLLVASFTRAAAAEVASRDLPIASRQVGTLHSFAYRAIGASDIAESHVSEFNETHPTYALSEPEGHPDIEDRVAEAGGRTEGDKWLGMMEVARARRTDPAWWPPEALRFAYVWNAWKLENDYLDFTDLIEHALTDTTTAPGEPAVGLFDEVQDFTPLELALVRHWAEPMERILLAGDDDQCIYGFKGATPDAFLDPPIPDDRKRVLRQSYRVPRAVHATASEWVGQLSRREPKAYEPRDDDGCVRVLDSVTWKVPELLARELEDHLAVPERTVMILATCSFMLEPLKYVLRRDAVPFHNPYRRKRGDWNPLVQGTEKRRTALDRVLAYLRTQPEVWGEDARWYTLDDVRWWLDPMRADGLLRRGAKARLDKHAGLRTDPIDVDIFDALWADDETQLAAAQATMRGDLDWLGAHLLATKAKPFEYPLHVARRRGGATLRERPRVVIGTIHSVKGAQADVVYLFPDISIMAANAWDSGRIEEADALIRQFYVGMTRAREELVVCNTASAFSVDPGAMLRGRLTK